MSCVDANVRDWALELEDREMKRLGRKRPAARVSLAKRLGVAPGLLESLRRGRGKGLRGIIERLIAGEYIQQMEAEIGRITRTLDLARQRFDRFEGEYPAEVRAAETALQDARDKLAKIKG